MKQTKTKPKYDLWFLLVLAVMLYTVVTQLVNFCGLLAVNLLNLGLWARIIATGIATYGVIWIFQMYVKNTRDAARRGEKGDEPFGKFSD